nr:hypothetical protein [uncultured Flavobacterium sp.]
MKQKQFFIRFFFAIALLGSIVAQSFHGYEHLEKQFSEKVCFHQHKNSTELTHQHKGFEQCLVCAISFHSVIEVENFVYHLASNPQVSTNYFFTSPTIISFSGSLYSLRGPPQCIV